MKRDRSAQGKQSQKKGGLSETIACFLLKLKGYEILERNCRPHRGIGHHEIDIIARIGQTICFIEVKYRQDMEKGAYAITHKIKQRIVKTSEMYLAFHPKYASYNIRFDVLLMKPFSFPMHIKDAWRV